MTVIFNSMVGKVMSEPSVEPIIPLPCLRPEDEIYFAPHKRALKFFNPWGGSLPPKIPDILQWMIKPNPHRAKKRVGPALLSEPQPLLEFDRIQSDAKVLWLGHASVLVEIDGVRVLVDPVLGNVAGLVRRRGPAPVQAEELHRADVVLITHAHWDHFDPKTLLRLLRNGQDAPLLAVPLGLGRSAPRGFDRVLELDWWQKFRLGPLEFAFVPAQHWHRRTVFDQNRVLWGGWMIRGSRSLYHCGDTGYFGGFRVIGETLGSPDLALLPIGAYEPRSFMRHQHMNPSDSLHAWRELGAGHFLGIHWGTYDLSDEPMNEGPRELQRVMLREGIASERVSILQHGGSLRF